MATSKRGPGSLHHRRDQPRVGQAERRALQQAMAAAAPPPGADAPMPDRSHLNETERRIAEIKDLMTLGRWVHRVTLNFLAGKWGISEGRVAQLAAEARRGLAAEIGDADREAYRTRICATLDRVIALNMAPGGEHRTAVYAIKALASVLGLNRLVLEHERPRDPFDGWTPAEALTYAQTGQTPARLRAAGRPVLTTTGTPAPEKQH